MILVFTVEEMYIHTYTLMCDCTLYNALYDGTHMFQLLIMGLHCNYILANNINYPNFVSINGPTGFTVIGMTLTRDFIACYIWMSMVDHFT